MTPEAIMPLNVDSTMITCARSCLEKFRLEFVYGLRPPGISIDLHAGACFATALEAFRKAIFQSNKPTPEALQLAHAAFAVAWGNFEIPEFKKTAKTFDNMWRAVESYVEKYPPLTDHIQPYFVGGKPTFEFTFAIPLEPCVDQVAGPDQHGAYESYDPEDHMGCFPLHPSGEPWLYSGRLDMLGMYQGAACFEDDKTTGRSISTGWADQWNLRNQFIGYTWALRNSGVNVRHAVVRGIAIQVKEIKHAEAIKSYSDYLIDVWHEQLRRDMWRIRRAWDTGYFDLNLADACSSYGNCIFMDICGSREKLSWMNALEVRRWNPLHKNPVDSVEALAA